MKKYEPTKTDEEFEEWWFRTYTNRPTMIQRQCFEAGYFAGQAINMFIVSAFLATLITLFVVLLIKF